MPPQPSDPWLVGILLFLAIASFGTWFALWGRRDDGPILPYEPRRPVPWSGIWTLLPILFVVLVVVGAVRAAASNDGVKHPEIGDTVEQMAFGSIQEVAFVVAFLTVVVVASGATRSDLGLPNDLHELVRDIRIGFVAWLASLAPVYGVQILLVSVFRPSEGHPLIKLLEEQANPLLFVAAFVVAVVVAPVCEELMFRLLLQGWLEKWEDLRLGWREAAINDEARMTNDELQMPETIPTTTGDEGLASDQSLFDIRHSSLAPTLPPRIGLGGLPYGSLPILISSVLFALAHVGYGPEPMPLFFLALILGYVYQRTHRIVPSIVAHALFNGMSLFALWRVISTGAQ